MRILLDCRFQKGAGPNVQSTYLLDNIIKLNSDHEFIILQHRGQALPEYPEISKVYVPTTNLLGEFLWVQCWLPILLYRRRIDICHGLKHPGPLLTSVPTIIHVREVGHFFPEGRKAFQLSLAMTFYWGHFLVWAMKRSNHVFGNSRECVEVPRKLFGIAEEKTSVLNNGLDEKFRVVKESNAIVKRKNRYGLPEKYILCVGNLYPHKNYDTVVRMLARLRQEMPNCPNLVFVGDKSYAKPEFFELINQLGLEQQVYFTNFVDHDDLVYIYNGAEILLFPAIVASFPNPTIEAMACGVPVVASNRGAVQEITGGAAVLLEDPKDVDEMARAISNVLKDTQLRENLVQRGIARAQNFSWGKSVKKIFDVYRSIGPS